jgi:hypothetical protein
MRGEHGERVVGLFDQNFLPEAARNGKLAVEPRSQSGKMFVFPRGWLRWAGFGGLERDACLPVRRWVGAEDVHECLQHVGHDVVRVN